MIQRKCDSQQLVVTRHLANARIGPSGARHSRVEKAQLAPRSFRQRVGRKVYTGRHPVFGLEDRVTLCGFERDFLKIWTDHHLHILISRAEGLALALIESMFCGRPAVVTRTGGNHELLRDNEDGLVSAGEHPEVIRETLERAWINRQRWPEMGKAAFQRANEWVPKDLSVRLFQTICDSSSGSMS